MTARKERNKYGVMSHLQLFIYSSNVCAMLGNPRISAAISH